jgi:hypothetical protein
MIAQLRDWLLTQWFNRRVIWYAIRHGQYRDLRKANRDTRLARLTPTHR